MWFEDLIERIDRLVWGPLLLGMLMGTGVYLSILLKFLSVRRLKTALKYALGLEEKRETKQGKNCKAAEKEQQSRGRVSSFSSLTTELAATIGTGNIIGVSTAMVLGGPGALFWMVITSIFGMATKLVESSLAVRFRVTNKKGQTVGGPMYVMEQVFPIRCLRHVMAWWFAFLAVCASFGMGNMVQANSIAEALFVTFHVPKAESGLILIFGSVDSAWRNIGYWKSNTVSCAFYGNLVSVGDCGSAYPILEKHSPGDRRNHLGSLLSRCCQRRYFWTDYNKCV